MSNETNAYEATDHATFDSKRKGNWATPIEIKSRLNKPVTENLVTVLNRLAHDKRIQKKKDMRLYRTRKGGAGGIESLGNLDGDETPRGTPDESPRGTPDEGPRLTGGEEPRGSRETFRLRTPRPDGEPKEDRRTKPEKQNVKEPKEKRRVTPEEMVTGGMGALIGGGMLGGIGGGGISVR